MNKLKLAIFSIFLISLIGLAVADDWPICIDLAKPSAPSNLSLNGNVELSWTAATDEPECSGVDYYKIYRNDWLIGTTANLTYTDGPLADGTYAYKVTAVDRAGLESIDFAGGEITITNGVENPTCAEASGFICSTDETCSGNWVTAKDSDRCCSVACTSGTGGNENPGGGSPPGGSPEGNSPGGGGPTGGISSKWVPTCEFAKGFVCSEGFECTGELITARDTENCCSVECTLIEEIDPCEGVSCDDSNPCTTDNCYAGACQYVNVADESVCMLEGKAGKCDAGTCLVSTGEVLAANTPGEIPAATGFIGMTSAQIGILVLGVLLLIFGAFRTRNARK